MADIRPIKHRDDPEKLKYFEENGDKPKKKYFFNASTKKYAFGGAKPKKHVKPEAAVIAEPAEVVPIKAEVTKEAVVTEEAKKVNVRAVNKCIKCQRPSVGEYCAAHNRCAEARAKRTAAAVQAANVAVPVV